MGVTLLTGATGRLGRALGPRLQTAGHELRAASRSPRDAGDGGIGGAGSERDRENPGRTEWVEVDLLDGTGVETAVAGADVVIHAATAPQGDSEGVDVAGTERLLDAAGRAGVSNFVYVSIVGVDEIPYAYYEHKLTAEEMVLASEVPATVLRATQFHGFVDDLLAGLSRLPVWPLPTRFRLQPIDVAEVADAVVDHATPSASGRVAPVGGPEVLSVGEIARAYRAARGLRRPVVRLPVPGEIAGGFRAGHATCPDHARGTTTWEAWLARRYGDEETEASRGRRHGASRKSS